MRTLLVAMMTAKGSVWIHHPITPIQETGPLLKNTENMPPAWPNAGQKIGVAGPARP